MMTPFNHKTLTKQIVVAYIGFYPKRYNGTQNIVTKIGFIVVSLLFISISISQHACSTKLPHLKNSSTSPRT